MAEEKTEMQAMQVDEALAHADEWIKGVPMYEGGRGWRVACATLAAEVRRLRKERDAAFALSRCECAADECCANQVRALGERQALAELLECAVGVLRTIDREDTRDSKMLKGLIARAEKACADVRAAKTPEAPARTQGSASSED